MTRDEFLKHAELEINEMFNGKRNRMMNLVNQAWAEGKRNAEVDLLKDAIDAAFNTLRGDEGAPRNQDVVYPTWFEWLEQIKVAWRAYELDPYFSGDREIYLRAAAFTPKAFEPIPADIAEKLGLQPKEDE